MDCKNALKFKPDYPKALQRAANNAFNIKDYNQCVQFCDVFLKQQPSNQDIIKLRARATMEKVRLQSKPRVTDNNHVSIIQVTIERNKRKQEKLEKNIDKENQRLFDVIKQKNIKLELINGTKYPDLQDLEPRIPQIAQNRVHLDEKNRLVWPVMFLYPETKQTDFVQCFHEDVP